ncbi:MAG: hypothetical protein WCB12_17610 [Bryobacteraceae bacterium]
MRRRFVMQSLVVALASSAAWAQGLQNLDIAILGGTAWNTAAWNRSLVVGGTNVTLQCPRGVTLETDDGYQVARVSAASLMADLSLLFPSPGGLNANVPVSAGGVGGAWAVTLGLRLMVPLSSRLSFYAVSGGGAGSFQSLVVTGGANPSVSTYTTHHGVFVFGGGADVRLSRFLSLRVEARDLVTGKELEGAAGRHHLLPMLGMAFHF